MSALILPAGASLTASLYRPVRETMAVGVVSFTGEHDGVPAEIVATNLILRMPELVAWLPDLLLPGAPVALLLHITPPDGMVRATAAAWHVERAMKRDALLLLISDCLPYVIQGAIVHLQGAVCLEATAPSTTTVQ